MAAMSSASSSHFASLTLQQVLEDLSSRFIVNLPAEELESIERICFQIEQAHWYYEDFIRPQASHLPSFSLKRFCELVFKSCPLLADYNAVDAYSDFLRYKTRVPVCGAILLSENWDKCLVVKGYKGSTWGFPKGKINQGENERDCAVREIWEETGYDISPHFNPLVDSNDFESLTPPAPLPEGVYPTDDWIEIDTKGQRIRLYVVPHVSEDTLFETKTRKEISAIAWAPLVDLPTWSKKAKKKDLKCYMVAPFVSDLRNWIRPRKPGSSKIQAAETPDVSSQNGERTLQTWQPDPEEVVQAEEQLERPVTPRNHADVLDKQSEALQSLFFGVNASPKRTIGKAFVPAAAAAVKSPKSRPIAQFESSIPQLSSAAPMQSPRPAYPVSDHRADSLLRLLQQSAMKAAQSASPSAQLPSENSPDMLTNRLLVGDRDHIMMTTQSATIEARSPAPLIPSAPSSDLHYTHGAVAVSSGYPLHIDQLLHSRPDATQGSMPAPLPYTEDEREEARHAILANLAYQLGSSITPPSPKDSGSEYDSREGAEDDEPDLDCASPVQDLVEIFKAQMLEDGQNRQMGELRLTNAVMRDLEERHAVKKAREEQIVNEARAKMGLQQTNQHTLSQSRLQILQVLQGARPPQLPNGNSASPQMPMQLQLQLQQTATPRHPASEPQSALLGLLNTAQSAMPAASEALSSPATAQTVLRSSYTSRQSPTDILRASQTSRHNAPPLPAGPRNPNIPAPSNDPADKTATLLGLLQAKSQLSSSMRSQSQIPDPRQYISQEQPVLPTTFADGARRHEFHDLVSQDQQLANFENKQRQESTQAAQMQQNSQIRHVQSLAALLQHGAPVHTVPAVLPDVPKQQQLPQAYAAASAYNVGPQQAQMQSNDLLKLFAAAQNPLMPST